MSHTRRFLVVLSIIPAVVAALLAPQAAAATGGTAPGGPGSFAAYLPADKSGFGTSVSTASKVWYTLQPTGGTGEIYYPRLDTPAARRLDFAVAGPDGPERADHHGTTWIRGAGLSYRQVETRSGAWQLTATYVTDPGRSTLLSKVRFTSLDGRSYRLYVVYEPTLSNTPGDDTARSAGSVLVASDGTSASALMAAPSFTATDNGYRGVNDPETDLRTDGRLNHHYSSARNGYVVQAGATSLTGRPGRRDLTLALGFGATASSARNAASVSAATGFGAVAASYARGWNGYLAGLRRAPSSLRTAAQRTEYAVSQMVLAASEDKIHRGAFVASPTMPWVWGAQQPSAPYHLVWSRDLYEIATALIAEGDRAAANRALNFLFFHQQKQDGSFPQNSDVTGTPVWTNLQLDEVADPIILAYQLRRFDRTTWQHVKAAADFLISFSQDGHHSPWSPQERWENQSGYSPASIASQIAGLVCAATIARANGDNASAAAYLRHADAWRANLKAWTVTRNGPYSPTPYFLRVTPDGQPNRATTLSIGDSGPSAVDQRKVVDPSFLELVRLGVLPAQDRTVRNSIAVVDKKLSYLTTRGRFWHRASFDGYGETSTGAEWTFDNPPDSFVTHGRGWPLLSGERGEYALAARDEHAAMVDLATMARSANGQYMLPEQVWDRRPPAGRPGFAPGTPTFSAMPLAWTHAQYIRLAVDASVGQVLEQPAAVADRYAGR